MAFWMGDNALLMALSTYLIVANMRLWRGAALAGVLAIASRETGSNKLAAKRIVARRDKLRRVRGARSGAAYLVMAITSYVMVSF